MNVKTLFALIFSGLIYFLVVLFNLFLQKSLDLVFKRGIIVLIVFFLLSWFILYIIEILSKNKKSRKENQKNGDVSSNMGEKNQEVKDNKTINLDENFNENFSPLNPPHLEVEEEE